MQHCQSTAVQPHSAGAELRRRRELPDRKMARLLVLLTAASQAHALEYCSALNDGQCETLRAHDTGAPVFLDTGSLGGETSLEDLLDTGILRGDAIHRPQSLVGAAIQLGALALRLDPAQSGYREFARLPHLQFGRRAGFGLRGRLEPLE